MAYFNGNVAKGEWTVVYCDACAEGGAVPFTVDRHGIPWQEKPWRWAPWPAGEPCHKCKKEL
jgi:hypothetical protein